jgi:hypothetical protein
MNNPNPAKLARRYETRRKTLGSDDPRCYYCDEKDIECLESEHPVGRSRDRQFTRVVCRNCHRKLERSRDVAGLTKNGIHDTTEDPIQELRSYLLLLALDHENTAASLRRRAEKL